MPRPIPPLDVVQRYNALTESLRENVRLFRLAEAQSDLDKIDQLESEHPGVRDRANYERLLKMGRL